MRYTLSEVPRDQRWSFSTLQCTEETHTAGNTIVTETSQKYRTLSPSCRIKEKRKISQHFDIPHCRLSLRFLSFSPFFSFFVLRNCRLSTGWRVAAGVLDVLLIESWGNGLPRACYLALTKTIVRHGTAALVLTWLGLYWANFPWEIVRDQRGRLSE